MIFDPITQKSMTVQQYAKLYPDKVSTAQGGYGSVSGGGSGGTVAKAGTSSPYAAGYVSPWTAGSTMITSSGGSSLLQPTGYQQQQTLAAAVGQQGNAQLQAQQQAAAALPNDMWNAAQGAYDEARAANEERYQTILKSYDTYGEAQKADILQRGQELQGELTQSMISRGLGATSANLAPAGAIQRGVERDIGLLGDRLTEMRAGVMERRSDTYPDYAMMANLLSGYGQAAGGGAYGGYSGYGGGSSGGGTSKTGGTSSGGVIGSAASAAQNVFGSAQQSLANLLGSHGTDYRMQPSTLLGAENIGTISSTTSREQVVAAAKNAGYSDVNEFVRAMVASLGEGGTARRLGYTTTAAFKRDYSV
jgi:hypothetical protein